MSTEEKSPSNVIEFPGGTFDVCPPDTMLEAQKGKFKELVMVGYDHEGNFVLCCSDPYLPDMMWLLELGKREVLLQYENNDD